MCCDNMNKAVFFFCMNMCVHALPQASCHRFLLLKVEARGVDGEVLMLRQTQCTGLLSAA